MPTMMNESCADKVPAVERPGFSRTCSLLSRYLKEKGSLGDLNLNLNFLDASSSPHPGRSEVPNLFPAKTMNLFPESKLNDPSCMNLNKDAGKEPETAPMTIFYAGNVVVFDDFPVERAKELMIMASRASILGAISPTPADPVTPPPPATESVSCDLPIARRASLHRFLEKRKDRLMARVPYQKAESPAKSKAWLEQAARSLVAEANKY